MNLMSSMAKTFEGSAIATVRVMPTRLMGMIRYFLATSIGNELDHFAVDAVTGEVDRGDAELPREAGGDLLLGDKTHLDQMIPESAAGGLLLLERLAQLFLRDEPLLTEHITKF